MFSNGNDELPHLVSQLVVWWFREGDLRDLEVGGIIDHVQGLETVGARVLDQLLAGLNTLCGLGTESLAMPILLILNARVTTSCQAGSGSDQLIIKSWYGY